ncbi:hypothetical protein ACFLTK_00110 [Chloroflexota bacterium]
MMSREAILTVLERTAKDNSFFSQLAQGYATALKEYELTSEERVALASGDVHWIESHIGAPTEQQLMDRAFILLLSREWW